MIVFFLVRVCNEPFLRYQMGHSILITDPPLGFILPITTSKMTKSLQPPFHIFSLHNASVHCKGYSVSQLPLQATVLTFFPSIHGFISKLLSHASSRIFSSPWQIQEHLLNQVSFGLLWQIAKLSNSTSPRGIYNACLSGVSFRVLYLFAIFLTLLLFEGLDSRGSWELLFLAVHHNGRTVSSLRLRLVAATSPLTYSMKTDPSRPKV